MASMEPPFAEATEGRQAKKVDELLGWIMGRELMKVEFRS
jgi:hypothetical protein